MEKPTTHSKPVRLFFFWSGIIATFAYRVIVILNNFSKFWAQIAWYIGTVGFILYFAHRYQISEKRVRLIKAYKLQQKVKELKELNTDEKTIMGYVLSSLVSSKEKWNSIFLFVVSIIALVIGLYLDFLKH